MADFLCKCAISIWNIPIPCDAEEAHSLIIKHFSIDPEHRELLVNQLIADILLDKYFDETYMTLNKYCEEYFYVNHESKSEREWKKPNEFEFEIHGNAMYTKNYAYKMMDREIKSYIKMMSKPDKEVELMNREMEPAFMPSI